MRSWSVTLDNPFPPGDKSPMNNPMNNPNLPALAKCCFDLAERVRDGTATCFSRVSTLPKGPCILDLLSSEYNAATHNSTYWGSLLPPEIDPPPFDDSITGTITTINDCGRWPGDPMAHEPVRPEHLPTPDELADVLVGLGCYIEGEIAAGRA